MRQSKRERVLFEELRFWQGKVRMEARWLKGSRQKCMEIGAELRKIQKERLG